MKPMCSGATPADVAPGDGPLPRATVLIPSYNHAPYVVSAVQSALDQTEPAIEVIVIDDGSSDDSLTRLEQIDDRRVTVLAQPNAGLSHTLNRGLALARARFVKFLPSDDMLAPDCIRRELEVAEATPDCVAVFALPEVVEAGGRRLSDPAPQAWFDCAARDSRALLRALVERNPLCAPSALFDRELALRVGGFDTGMRVAQDYDLWLRLLPRGEARLIPERLVRVRWHGANQSAVATPSTEAERERALRRALAEIGVDGWVRLFAAGDSSSGPLAEAEARAAFARALQRSGLASMGGIADDLLGQAARALTGTAAAASTSGDRAVPTAARARSPRWASRFGRLVERIRRVVSSTAGGPSRAAARWAAQPSAEAPHLTAGALVPGPRGECWIVFAESLHRGEDDDVGCRLAEALRGGGAAVHVATLESRPGGMGRGPSRARAARDAPPPDGSLDWDVAHWRELVASRDDRVFLLVLVPHAEVVAFAREARGLGARVVYLKTRDWSLHPDPWYQADNEQILIEWSDDLVALARCFVRPLSQGRRIVHLLPPGIEPMPVADVTSGGDPVARRQASDDGVALVCPPSLRAEWTDWGLLDAVAAARPAWTIDVAGEPGVASPGALAANVRLRPPSTEAPAAAQISHADAILVPALLCRATESYLPRELALALQARLPIVATRLPELAGFPHVRTAGDAMGVVAAVERVIATPLPAAAEDFFRRNCWAARAGSLRAIVDRQSALAFVVAPDADARAEEAIARPSATRAGGFSLRIAVVDRGSDEAGAAALAQREEDGEIQLLRCARPSAAAAFNLGVRATASELVALLPRGAARGLRAWIEDAALALLGERALGAVVDAASGAVALPRRLLLRLGGLDEGFSEPGESVLDLVLRVRAAGYRVAAPSGAGVVPSSEIQGDRATGTAATDRERLRGKWAHRPDLLAELATPEEV